MRARVADQLNQMGCTAGVDDFRRTLAEVKAEMFPRLSIDALIVTRDEAGQFCAEVRRQMNAPRLTRPFILTGLMGMRKNPPKRISGSSRPQPESAAS